MLGRSRTKNGQVRCRRFAERFRIFENLISRKRKRRDRILHPLRLLVTNANQFHLRMIVRHAQQIAHVEVVEVDSNDSQ